MRNATVELGDDLLGSAPGGSVTAPDIHALEPNQSQLVERLFPGDTFVFARSVLAVSDVPLFLPWRENSTESSPASYLSDLAQVGNTAPALVIYMKPEPMEDFVEVPTGVGQRHEPAIRGKGVPVWILVAYTAKRHMSPHEISCLWGGYITEEEVQAALAYWRMNPESVDDKLRDE